MIVPTTVRSAVAGALVAALAVYVDAGQTTTTTNYRPQTWVTKIVSEALDEYPVAGGETACGRHEHEYRDGLTGLRLWATQSKPERPGKRGHFTRDRISRIGFSGVLWGYPPPPHTHTTRNIFNRFQ